MIAHIDIENSKTQKVVTINVPTLKYIYDDEVIFDISNLSKKDFKLLKDAIDISLPHTEIELFFIDKSDTPNFGPDYEYKIIDNKLILKYIKKDFVSMVEEKNQDWTIFYEKDFEKIVYDFLKTNNNYLLVYYDSGLKYKFLKQKPRDSIFMDLFFNYNYTMIALFKKKNIVKFVNIRDSLEYINSYCENEIEERRKI